MFAVQAKGLLSSSPLVKGDVPHGTVGLSLYPFAKPARLTPSDWGGIKEELAVQLAELINSKHVLKSKFQLLKPILRHD